MTETKLRPTASSRMFGQWAHYWRSRPDVEPLDLEAVLDEVEPLDQADVDFLLVDERAKLKRKLFGHANLPDVAFIAVESRTDRLFIAMQPRELKLKFKHKPKPVRPLPIDLTPPLDRPDAVIHAWIKAKRAEIAADGKEFGLSTEHSAAFGKLKKLAKVLALAEAQRRQSPVLAAKRSEREKGRDKEFGWISNYIEVELAKMPAGTGKDAVADLYRQIRELRHRVAQTIN